MKSNGMHERGEKTGPQAQNTSDKRYNALIDASAGIVWRSAPDLSVIEAWGWDEFTGQPRSEYLGSGWILAVHAEDRDEVEAKLEMARAKGQPVEATYRVRNGDGAYRWVHARVVPLRDSAGHLAEWVGNLVDVHEKVEANIALAETEERLRLALESSAVGVWDYDYRTATGWWSEAKRKVLGLPDDYRITEESFLSLVRPEDRANLRTRMEACSRPGSDGRFEAEFRVRKVDCGEEVWISSRGQVRFDETGQPSRILGTMRDVTADRAAQDRLYRLAHFDQLTGLANRAHYASRVEEMLPSIATGAVILLDLDGFKMVNDTIGHAAGDLLLRAAATRLQAAIPEKALVARWGGDEFAIFVPCEGDVFSLDRVVREIEAAFEQPFVLLRREIHLGTSIGLAIAPAHGTSAEELLVNADLALYKAKGQGRGTSEVFCPALKKNAQDCLEIEADLRRGFSGGEFEMHFQPQIDLRTGIFSGAEALLRWRHPTKGLLSPGAFLSVLTTSPISEAVGNWTLSASCAAAARMLRAGQPIRIGVNLFSSQFCNSRLTENVKRCLDEHQLPPELLEIEITENVILKGRSGILDLLKELRDLGLSIAFDDYGTGYASLSMLTEYPLSRLKIDRSFIQGLSAVKEAALVSAIIRLGHAFNLSITAEGIETLEQAATLRDLGCHEGQGYLWGHPMPESEIRQLIAATSARRKPLAG